jgi:hypothetical protein
MHLGLVYLSYEPCSGQCVCVCVCGWVEWAYTQRDETWRDI